MITALWMVYENPHAAPTLSIQRPYYIKVNLSRLLVTRSEQKDLEEAYDEEIRRGTITAPMEPPLVQGGIPRTYAPTTQLSATPNSGVNGGYVTVFSLGANAATGAGQNQNAYSNLPLQSVNPPSGYPGGGRGPPGGGPPSGGFPGRGGGFPGGPPGGGPPSGGNAGGAYFVPPGQASASSQVDTYGDDGNNPLTAPSSSYAALPVGGDQVRRRLLEARQNAMGQFPGSYGGGYVSIAEDVTTLRKFKGARGDSKHNILIWITEYENYAAQHGWGVNKTIVNVTMYLMDDLAKMYYIRETAKVTTWEAAKTILVEYFRPPQRTLASTLNNISQGDKTVGDYYTQFATVVAQMPSYDSSIAATLFVKGLRPGLRAAVEAALCTKKNYFLEEAYEAATNLEATKLPQFGESKPVREDKKYFPGNNLATQSNQQSLPPEMESLMKAMAGQMNSLAANVQARLDTQDRKSSTNTPSSGTNRNTGNQTPGRSTGNGFRSTNQGPNGSNNNWNRQPPREIWAPFGVGTRPPFPETNPDTPVEQRAYYMMGRHRCWLNVDGKAGPAWCKEHRWCWHTTAQCQAGVIPQRSLDWAKTRQELSFDDKGRQTRGPSKN